MMLFMFDLLEHFIFNIYIIVSVPLYSKENGHFPSCNLEFCPASFCKGGHLALATESALIQIKPLKDFKIKTFI